MRKYFIASVGNAEGFVKKDNQLKHVISSRTLTESTLGFTSSQEEVRAGQGAKLYGRFNHTAGMTVSLTDAMFDISYITLQTGSDKQMGGSVVKTETVTPTVNDAGNLVFSLSSVPVAIGQSCGLDKIVVAVKTVGCEGGDEKSFVVGENAELDGNSLILYEGIGKVELVAGGVTSTTTSTGNQATMTMIVSGKKVTVNATYDFTVLGESLDFTQKIGTVLVESGKPYIIPETPANSAGYSSGSNLYYGYHIYASKNGVSYSGEYVADTKFGAGPGYDAGSLGHYRSIELREEGEYTLYYNFYANAINGPLDNIGHQLSIDMTGVPDGMTDPRCVSYFYNNSLASLTKVAANFIPAEMILMLTAKLYEGDANAPESGKPAGEITVKIPRFQLDGQFDLSMAMSSAATMSLNGTALATDAGGCDDTGVYAEIVQVIDGQSLDDVVSELAFDTDYLQVGDVPIVYGKTSDGLSITLSNSDLVFDPLLKPDGTMWVVGEQSVSLKSGAKVITENITGQLGKTFVVPSGATLTPMALGGDPSKWKLGYNGEDIIGFADFTTQGFVDCDRLFKDNKNLRRFDNNSSAYVSGVECFYNCVNFEGPNGFGDSKPYMFYGCKGMSALTLIYANPGAIGPATFATYSFANIGFNGPNLNASDMEFSYAAHCFDGNDNVKTLTIGGGGTIYANAFAGMKITTLKILYEGSTDYILENTNALPSTLTRIEVPSARLSTYKAATNWSAFANIIVGV